MTAAMGRAGRRAGRSLAGLALLAGLLLAGPPLGVAPAVAHHGWGDYSTALLELTGRVRAYSHVAPHALLELEVGDQAYQALLAAPATLEERGLTPDMIRVGETVTVQGYPHRRNRAEFRAERIRVGGKTYQMR